MAEGLAAVAGGATGPRTEAESKGGVPVALGGRHFAKGPATRESGGLDLQGRKTPRQRTSNLGDWETGSAREEAGRGPRDLH